MKPATLKILRALEQAGEHGLTTGMLVSLYSSRFGARIKELRDDGYEIRMEHLRPGSARYTLVGRAASLAAVPYPVSSQDRAELDEPPQGPVYRSPVFCLRCLVGEPHTVCVWSRLAIDDASELADAA